jgi:hypothetical protein
MHQSHGKDEATTLVCLRFEFRASQVEIMNGHGKHVEIRLGRRPTRFTWILARCAN